MDQRSGMEPSDALKLRILGLSGSLTLDELFAGDSTLNHLRKVARLKIVGVFRVAGEIGREVTRRPLSASYILPGDGTAEQLVAAIMRHTRGHTTSSGRMICRRCTEGSPSDGATRCRLISDTFS